MPNPVPCPVRVDQQIWRHLYKAIIARNGLLDLRMRDISLGTLIGLFV